MYGYNAEIKDTKLDLLRCHFYSIQRFERFNNINKVDPFFTQLDTKEQANILLYCYPPSKPNALNQDIIKFVINLLKISGRFDKPCVMYYYYFSFCVYAYFMFFCFVFAFCFFFLLENKGKFAAYNWLQISCINTLHLINSSFASSILICDQL